MTEEKKTEVWAHMLALPKSFRGNGMTDRRIKQLKSIVWNDHTFWIDIIRRHGLERQTLENLKESDASVYNHCVGNFWSMLYRDAIQFGIIKQRIKR